MKYHLIGRGNCYSAVFTAGEVELGEKEEYHSTSVTPLL